MANSLTFVKGAGGLGRELPGEDHISAYLHYTSATLPTGFSSGSRIKLVYSVAEAEALGITDASLGATASTSTFEVTNKGAVGDTMSFTCSTITGAQTGVPVVLASYTQVTADVTSLTTAAARLSAEINLGTATHGFTASPSTATVTITAPKNQGVFLNTGSPYVATIVGTLAGTLVQNVVTGVMSTIDIMHYNISEYFRMQPKGVLYIGIYAVTTDFAEVSTMQNYSQGVIRQMGVYTHETFATGDVTKLQTQATAMEAVYKPLEILYLGNFSAVSDLTTLSQLHALTAQNVSPCFGQDGAETGYHLWKATAKSIGCLGTTLGTVSLAKVNESIAWIGKFNIADGEFETLAFANGTALNTLTDGQINAVDDKGYIFLKKHVGLDGSYFDNPYTAVAVISDYSRINFNRTINKAIRSLRTYILPTLASPLLVNTDGTLTEDVIAYYETLGQRALDIMVRNGELSGFTITINPAQNVISTSTLTIAVALLLVPSADVIVVNIGFATSL